MADEQGYFAWYELMTNDIAAARQFYGAVVQWRMQDAPMPGMDYTLLNAGEVQVGGMMTLPQSACDAGATPCWVGYIAVPDVDAAAARVLALGGAVHAAPADIPGVGRFAMVADPQGAAFNLFRALQPAAPAPSAEAGHVGWHELHTSDWEGAFTFYSALFGWQKGESIPMGTMGTYQLFSIAGAGAGAMFNSPAAAQRCFWQYYFTTGDIDAAAARVTGAGGAIQNGPQEVPGGGWIVQAADPQQAQFALLGSRS